MKQIKKLLMLVVLMMCLAPCLSVKASTDSITVIEVTSSTATFDVTNFVDELVSYDWTPISYDILLSNYYSSSTISTGNTKTDFMLTNLQSGIDYYVDVIMTYRDTNGISDTTTRTAFFTTLGVTEDHEETTEGTSSTLTPTPTPVVNNTVPSIKKVVMSSTTVQATIDMNGTDGVEYKICRKKDNKTVATGDIITSSAYKYGIKANHVYYIIARTYVYDDNYNKVYSNWSDKKYFVSQPTISTKKSKIKSNYVSLKWSKVTGAKNYTIYGRNRGSKSWKKITTTKKTSYKVTKIKGKKLNCVNKNYEFTIVANAKIGKKTYKSNKKKYIYTYTIYK